MENKKDNLMTVDELANYLRFRKTLIYSFIKSGYIPAYRISGQWRFRESDIEKWLEQQIYCADKFSEE